MVYFLFFMFVWKFWHKHWIINKVRVCFPFSSLACISVNFCLSLTSHLPPQYLHTSLGQALYNYPGILPVNYFYLTNNAPVEYVSMYTIFALNNCVWIVVFKCKITVCVNVTIIVSVRTFFEIPSCHFSLLSLFFKLARSSQLEKHLLWFWFHMMMCKCVTLC